MTPLESACEKIIATKEPMTAVWFTDDEWAAFRAAIKAKGPITREKFIVCTGREPIQDDLERCNCPDAGKLAHTNCGWNTKYNCPQFDACYREWARHA